MKRSLLVSGLGISVICAVILISLKVGDLALGLAMTSIRNSNLNSYNPFQFRRSIILRELSPNASTTVRPLPAYMAGTDGLQAKDFVLKTDENGFILGHEMQSEPVDITFIGGSTTECLFVDEQNRFPALTARLLRKAADGSPVHTQNAGVSGNHSLHSTLNLIAKVLPLKPHIVVMMEHANDLTLLLNTGSYWKAPMTRALIQRPGAQAQQTWFRSAAKSIKDFVVPNTWNVLLTYFPGLTAPSEVDEFADFRSTKPNVSHITDDFRASITGAISLLRAWGIEPVLMTQFNRVNEHDVFIKRQFEGSKSRVSFHDYVAYYAEFNDIVRGAAKDSGVPLIDLDSLIPRNKTYIYDAFHVNDVGSRLVAEIVAREIARMFPEYVLVSGLEPVRGTYKDSGVVRESPGLHGFRGERSPGRPANAGRPERLGNIAAGCPDDTARG